MEMNNLYTDYLKKHVLGLNKFGKGSIIDNNCK